MRKDVLFETNPMNSRFLDKIKEHREYNPTIPDGIWRIEDLESNYTIFNGNPELALRPRRCCTT